LVIQRSCPRYRSLFAGALALVAIASSRPAAEVIDGQVAAFNRFIQAGRPICLHRPAAECIQVAWAFADVDGDRRLSLAELATIRDGLERWAIHHKDDLSQPELSSIVLGLLLVDSIGLERLVAVYDTDRDGLISRRELLADVRLDQRPLGEILLDPEAVDRRAIARRLGLSPTLIDRLQP
jgi:Ca2+-binding EF-hand superfamily protein